MADLYGSLALHVEGAFEVAVFGHVEFHYLVLTGCRAMEGLVHRLARYGHRLLYLFLSMLLLRPVELESMVFHFPCRPGFVM